MTKGTASKGQKRNKGRIHIRCRRCGKTAYHKIQSICSSCGYGKTKKLRRYNWDKKTVTKKRKITRRIARKK